MSVFSADTVHRVVSHNGQEIILFSRDKHLFVDFASRGTMKKAEFKRSMFWIFKHLGLILAIFLIPIFTIIASIAHPAFGLLGILAFTLGFLDVLSRFIDKETFVENFWNFENDNYFNDEIFVSDLTLNDFLRKHLSDMPDQDFVDLCEKFVNWNEAKTVRNQLRKQLDQAGYDSEIAEYAQTKLDEIDSKVNQNDKEFNVLVESCKNIERDQKDKKLITALIRTEKVLAS